MPLAAGLTAGITVLVPSFRRPDHLARCLQALRDQISPPEETLVVVRRDDEATAEVCRRFSSASLRVVSIDAQGVVAALNAGLAAVRTEIVALTDDDCVPHPDWVEAITRRFAEDPRIGAVGGRDIVHHEDAIDVGATDQVGRIRWFGKHIGRHHWIAPLQDVQFLKGANTSYRREALDGFDERLRGSGAQVCSDLEASLSTWRRGWRVVYDPAVQVDHFPAERFDEDGRRERSLSALRDEAHNELYALLQHVPWWQKPFVAAYRLLVGKRGIRGPLLALREVARGSRLRAAGSELSAATAGRLAALGTFARARTTDRGALARAISRRCSSSTRAGGPGADPIRRAPPRTRARERR